MPTRTNKSFSKSRSWLRRDDHILPRIPMTEETNRKWKQTIAYRVHGIQFIPTCAFYVLFPKPPFKIFSEPCPPTPVLDIPKTPQIKRVAPGRDGAHIPRPRNAFFLYRQSLQNDTGMVEHDRRHVSTIIGLSWKSLPEEQKAYWRERAIEEKARHAELYPDYRYSPIRRTKSKRNVKKTGPEDRKRFQEVAQLLAAGKKGDELVTAVEEKGLVKSSTEPDRYEIRRSRNGKKPSTESLDIFRSPLLPPSPFLEDESDVEDFDGPVEYIHPFEEPERSIDEMDDEEVRELARRYPRIAAALKLPTEINSMDGTAADVDAAEQGHGLVEMTSSTPTSYDSSLFGQPQDVVQTSEARPREAILSSDDGAGEFDMGVSSQAEIAAYQINSLVSVVYDNSTSISFSPQLTGEHGGLSVPGSSCFDFSVGGSFRGIDQGSFHTGQYIADPEVEQALASINWSACDPFPSLHMSPMTGLDFSGGDHYNSVLNSVDMYATNTSFFASCFEDAATASQGGPYWSKFF